MKPIRTQQGYTEDYESLAALHRLANDKGVSIILLHHTRKMEAEDPVDTVSGTFGLAGCADSVLVLNRSSQGTTLYVRGRDIEEAEHAVSFDKAGCRWTILGNATEVHRSNERNSILAVLMRRPTRWDHLTLRPRPICRLTTRSNYFTRWSRAGEVGKVGRGQYVHPSRVNPATPDNFDNAVTNDRNTR